MGMMGIGVKKRCDFLKGNQNHPAESGYVCSCYFVFSIQNLACHEFITEYDQPNVKEW